MCIRDRSIMDIYTGEIIAMTSSPSFDPNLFLYGIDKVKWIEIKKNPLKPIKILCFLIPNEWMRRCQ